MSSATYSAFFKIYLKRQDLAPVILSSLERVYPLKQREEKAGLVLLEPDTTLEWRNLPFIIPPLRKLFADIRKELQERRGEGRSFPYFDLKVWVWENTPGRWRKEKPLKGSSDHYVSRIQVGGLCSAERTHYDSDISGRVGSLHRGLLINYMLFFWLERSEGTPEKTIIPLLDNEQRICDIFETYDRYG